MHYYYVHSVIVYSSIVVKLIAHGAEVEAFCFGAGRGLINVAI